MARDGDKRFVGTLGDLLNQRRSLYLNCERAACRHSVKVDLPAMAEFYGIDYPLHRFMARAKCSRCGAKLPEISLTAPPIDASGIRE